VRRSQLDTNHRTRKHFQNTYRQAQFPGIINWRAIRPRAPVRQALARPPGPRFLRFPKWVRIGFGPRASSFCFNILVASVLKKTLSVSGCSAGVPTVDSPRCSDGGVQFRQLGAILLASVFPVSKMGSYWVRSWGVVLLFQHIGGFGPEKIIARRRL